MIVATAGHVDHGKSALVRFLTGVEPDRLKEEKQRGLSIVLGYAYMQVDSGEQIGFIDVPGHERFMKAMISGVSEIDLALLVVSAKEGLKPQTVEHARVLEILGVKQLIVVVTKTDLVGPVRLAEVRESVKRFNAQQVLETSVVTGRGFDKLKSELVHRSRSLPLKISDERHFRLSLDRAFYLSGQGLVATGTILSGRISVGDSVRIEPQNATAKIRKLHANGSAAESAIVGQRCALNLNCSLSKEDLQMGDWIVSPQSANSTTSVDVLLELSPNIPSSKVFGKQLHLYLGAKRQLVTVVKIASESRRSASQRSNSSVYFVRLSTVRPIHATRGDKLLLRDAGDRLILAGGEILEPHPPFSALLDPLRAKYLCSVTTSDDIAALEKLVRVLSFVNDFESLLKSWNVKDSKFLENQLHQRHLRIIELDDRRVCASHHWLEENKECLLKAVRQSSCGELAIAALHKHLPQDVDDAMMRALLSELVSEQKLSFLRGKVTSRERINGIDADTERWEKIQAMLVGSIHSPPATGLLAEQLELTVAAVSASLHAAKQRGLVVRISSTRYILGSALSEYKNALFRCASLSPDRVGIELKAFRSELLMGRNAAIELLEYFDSLGVTVRENGQRRLSSNWSSSF